MSSPRVECARRMKERADSERIPQHYLNASSGRYRLGRLAEGAGFEEADGDAVVGAVDEVESLDAQEEALPLVEVNPFINRHVQLKNVARAERVAPDPPVLPDGREQ